MGHLLSRQTLLGCATTAAILIPILLAANSPLLAWRSPIYIAGGLAGILGMALLLIQPLLAGGYLGLDPKRSKQMHRIIGMSLGLCVTLHVAALWITSPPDMIDALLLRSPTPFSLWGVIAMWTLLATTILVWFKNRLKLPPRTWRRLHTTLAAIIIAGTTLHALQIEGTMQTLSKTVLALLIIAAFIKLTIDKRIWTLRR